MIYLDYTATTPVDEEVLDAYVKATHNFFANTTSLHKLGQESNYMYENASNQIKDILKINNHNLIFTSNATEANNLAIQGYLKKYKAGKIITTKIEHASVYEVFKAYETIFDVVYLDITDEGIIDIEQLKKEIDCNTIFISIMWVNNIIGTIQPINQIVNILKKYPKIKLHVDMVQGIGKINPNFSLNDIDMFTFSTHKLYGPKGIGGLFIKKELAIQNILYGSKSQYSIKPGTFDLSLIVATTKVFKKFYPMIDEYHSNVKQKFDYLYSNLQLIKGVVINTPQKYVSHYIINISIPKTNGETSIHYFEKYDIYVSTGSACSSKLKQPEKTIMALTNSYDLATSSIRISLSYKTTIEEIDYFLDKLKKYVGDKNV